MFAFLATASAQSINLQVGSHFVSGTEDLTGIFPSDSAQYIYFSPDPSSETFYPSLEIHKPGESTTLRFGKSAVVHYSLFKIPANYKYFFGFNSVTQNKWTIPAESVVILLFSKPISCKVEGTNLLTSSTPTDFTQSGQEGNSYFLGSTIIAIKTSTTPATVTFSGTTPSDVASYNNSNYSPQMDTADYTEPDRINANHLGVYTISKTGPIPVTPKDGYKIQCIQCTFTDNSLSAVDNKPIVFVVFTGATDFDYIATNNGFRYISTSGSQRSGKTTYIVSDLPFTLTFSKTSDTTLSLGDSFDMGSSLDPITKDKAAIYDQFIGLKLGDTGVFFIEKISGEASQITATTSEINGIQKTDNNCKIINVQGTEILTVASTTILAVNSNLVTYYLADNSYQSTKNGQATITATDKQYYLITVPKETIIVSGDPTNTIFSTSTTTKILFISGSQASSSRSLREDAGKSITYYSSSSATIQVLPFEILIDKTNSMINSAIAVYIEETDTNQKAIGIISSTGYTGSRSITPDTQPLSNPMIFTSSQQLTAATANTKITLIPNPNQKNVLVLMDPSQFVEELSNLYVFNQITEITPKNANLKYGVVLLDNNIDRISAIIDPQEYTRKTVAQGNCAIIVISSTEFTYTFVPQYSISPSTIATNFYLLTAKSTSDIYIDFTKGSSNPEKIVNYDNSKPALANYDPTWDPSDNYNGTIIKEGRYDFKLTSTVQTVTASTNTIVFFVPKSMDQKVVINVINPVDGTKDVRKLDLFKNKILGYYFDTALNIELSGESNLEIYVYKLTITPSSFEDIVFKRGGSEITSKSLGFVGFSNYSLCAVPSPPSDLKGYDGSAMYGKPIFTGNPFYFTKGSTVKYELKRADTNDPKEEEFTIPTSDNLKGGVSAASMHKQEGELVKYEPDSGLTKGQVAGIVVAIILFIIIDIAIVVLVCYCRKHEPKPQFNFEEEEDALEGDIGADPDGGDVQAGPDVPEDAPAEEEPAKE